MNSLSAIVKRHWQVLVFILGLVFVCWLVWVLQSVLLPFIVGFVIAYVLLPIIRWIEKHLPAVGKRPQLKRITIIVVINLLALAVIGFSVFYVVTVMGSALLSLAQSAPQIIPNGLATIKQLIKSIPSLSSPAIQAQIDILALQASEALSNALQNFLARQVTLVEGSSGMLLGFISMPIFVFFILKDWNKLRDSLQRAIPQWSVIPMRSVFFIIQNATGRYIRGQLFLGLVVGTCAGVMLFILRIEYALPLAVVAGLTEMVPLIGPWIGGGLGVLVTLSTTPEKTVWVALGYLMIQFLENNLLVPKIQGSQMDINPAYIIVLSVLGAYFAGILGFIIILPLTVTILGIFAYLRKSIREGTIK